VISVILSALDFGQSLAQASAGVEGLGSGLEVVPVRQAENRAAALNAAVEAARGEILLFLPSFVEPLPGLVDEVLAGLAAEPAAGIVYGDYTILVGPGNAARQTLLAHHSDLSEWSGIGYVSGMRREVFHAAGGYDPAYRFVEEYDLRLRISRRARLVRTAEPLCRLDRASVSLEDERVKQSLRRWFTPESSPKKGYGYLFSSPDADREIERAFAAELRARGAYLEGGTSPVACPHGQSRPAVSVVIPVYNRARYLANAVGSVLAGEYRDVEILVVDGGSTDGTVETAEELARGGAPIRVLHNPARVVATALNVGLRAARGKYVAQLDSDDEYTPSTLRQSVAYLEAHPECALAISYYDFIDDAGRELEDLGVVRHLEYDRNAILRTNGAGAVRVWHRCVLERLDGFREEWFPDYAEDYDMILRLSERYAVGRVPGVLYRCRLHASNSDQRLSTEDRARKKALARAHALDRRAELLRSRSMAEVAARD
jgi:GT2 family glycosyltransferase